MSQASPSTSHLALPFGLALPSPSTVPSPSGPSAAPSGAGTGSGTGASPASGNGAAALKRRRPAGANGKGKIRKRAQANGQRNLADTELNEADDVDDSELIAGPDRSSRALAEADLGYGDGDEEGDEGEGEEGEDGEEGDEGEDGVEGEEREDVGGANGERGAGVNGSATKRSTPDGHEREDEAGDAGGDAVRGGLAMAGAAGGANKRIRRRQQQETGGIFRPPKKGEELYDEARVKMRLEQQKDTANMLSQVIGPEQARRFEAFSQASLNRIAIRRLVTAKYDQPLNDTLLRPLAGLGKVFVTEVTELAKDIQEHSPHPTGPLQPYHLRLAREVLIEQGILGASGAEGAARRGNPLA